MGALQKGCDTLPNKITYTIAIKSLQNSIQDDKAVLARRMLAKMKLMMKSGKVEFSPDERAYSAVFSVCSSKHKNENDRRNALEVFVEAQNCKHAIRYRRSHFYAAMLHVCFS